MNKIAIKNFAIWARNKLIKEITYKAGLVGITEKGIADALPQSTKDMQWFDIGTSEPSSIQGEAVKQREMLVRRIREKKKGSDYKTAYTSIIEEVAYTWFNRLIAIRFMEVNDYLPSRVRVLSSEIDGKEEPDLVTSPFNSDLEFTSTEADLIMQYKDTNQLDELFRMLFIKQCNKLNEILPQLFEPIQGYKELLLNISFTDKDGVVYHLTHDIDEAEFNIEKEGQVEILGWMYQYYNTELNEIVYDGSMCKNRVPKELLPAATTIYTPDWAIRYMVENSLGKLWNEGHKNEELMSNLKYFLQDSDVEDYSIEIQNKYRELSPEQIKIIDPCMGSGHILVYCFELLMSIYKECGYTQRNAAKLIIEKNLYGLDIDERAYQMAYFAVMMKGREYNRRIFQENIQCNLYGIKESNYINRSHLTSLGAEMDEERRSVALKELNYLLEVMTDAKEYGSILKIKNLNWKFIEEFINQSIKEQQISIETVGLKTTQEQLKEIIEISKVIANKYNIVITNPPYLSNARFSEKLTNYVNQNYSDVKTDLSMIMYKKAIDDLIEKDGFIAFITTSSWLSIKSFKKLREYVLEKLSFESLVDFGTELFEGKVGHNPIVAWVNRNSSIDKRMVAVRLVEYCYSRRCEKESQFFNPQNRFYPSPQVFRNIPGIPFTSYWMDKIDIFKQSKIGNRYISGGRNKTHNNDKYVRCWWEVENYKKWKPYAKGGEFRRWYGNNYYVVDWSEGAKKEYDSHGGLYNQKFLNKTGICWSLITSYKTSFRIKQKEFHYDSASPVIFNEEFDLNKYDLGLLNSKVAEMILKVYNPTMNMGVSYVLDVPCIVSESKRKRVEELVESNVNLMKRDWDSFERSWEFNTLPLWEYSKSSGKIRQGYVQWEEECIEKIKELKSNEEELNEIFISLYDFSNVLSNTVEEKDITLYKPNLENDIRTFISYVMGCIMGRYNNVQETLQTDIIILTDEDYFEDDVVGLFCEYIRRELGEENLEDNLEYIATALGNKGTTSREVIRNYFIRDFFKDHCSMYATASSGKCPIYWLFDSGKQNSFKALIYMHHYNADTIGNLRIDYLHRLQKVYESEIARMQDIIDNSNNAKESTAAAKRKDKLVKQLQETKDYDQKIAHLALARTEINLDDGVKVNYEKVQTGTDGKKLEVLAKI